MRPPSSSGYQNQLLSMFQQSNAQLNAQTAQYSANQTAANAAALSAVNSQESAINTSVNNAASSPVNLGTILTTPQGSLGNPMLALTKLGS
jgi:hypothetical protein